ncbi:MAG: hypothetical protein OSA22_05005 [Aquiluna sp.]|nr:hypothetical protein [Aquiluna sp.]
MERNELLELWHKQRLSIGGTNPLVQFELSSFGQVDLSRSHPGGLAQLASARSSTISNLVRDGVAQSRALNTSRRILKKAHRIERNFGIDALFIAGGLVSMGNAKMPILLWRSHLLPKGEDFELRVDSIPRVNPALVSVIKTYRSDFRVSDLIAVSQGQTDLIPTGVLSLVSELIQDPDVEIEKLLVMGNFVPDLTLNQQSELEASSSLIMQLTGKVPAPGVESPTEPCTLVLNADADQQKVLDRALAGNSFAVETLPGCGYLQTVVNLIANLSVSQKRALIIAPRQQTLDELAERLSASKLPGLAVRQSDSWGDAVAAISRNEKATLGKLESARDLVARRQVDVEQYFSVVQSRENNLGVSVIEALGNLASLASLPSAPVNNARIGPEILPTIRADASDLLNRAHEAGLFATSPIDGPWFQAKFDSEVQISEALVAVRSLAGEEFRMLKYQINLYLSDLNLSPSKKVEDWSHRLNLLIGIRETLDKFKPEIFDRSLQEMISATAPRGDRGALSGAQRRRFRKLAKGYLRPGAAVANLYQALVEAERQRASWSDFNLTQAPPTVPLGLSDVQSKFQQIYGVLEILQRHLNPDPDIELLTRMDLDQLAVTLEDLGKKTNGLDHYMQRLPISKELVDMGLGQFTKEVSKSRPEFERLQREFELTWWQSALEAIIQSDSRILEYTAEAIATLESDFERANEDLIAQGLLDVRHQLAEAWHAAIAKQPAQADALRAQLRTKKIELKAASQVGGDLYRVLVPAVSVSPYRIHELDPAEKFDLVIVLDASSTGLAEAQRALSMADQVLAFGDPIIATPENFDTVARANQAHVETDRGSVFDLVAEVFGSLGISRNYRVEGQVLGKYLNDNFYGSRLVIEPAAGQLFGSHNFEQIEITDDANASSTIEGSTESLDSEVSKVAELVMSHARWSPEDSLMVVAASRTHAERIDQLVRQETYKQPQLAEFFDAHGREKFECVSMSELTHRLADRVIFSVGFGRTPEGKISGTLGDFNFANVSGWMVNQIVSARKRMTVVSCYNFEDFAAGGLPENQRWLKDLIAPSFMSDVSEGQADPLLRDLALRLEKLGLKVALNFGGRIGLAVSFGKKAAVVDPDWALVGENWDEKLRVRPGLLRAMGWDYQRIHALEIFAKPQDVANRIAMSLGVDLISRAQPLFDDRAFEDTSGAWGHEEDSNDDRLRDDKPPHWG